MTFIYQPSLIEMNIGFHSKRTKKKMIRNGMIQTKSICENKKRIKIQYIGKNAIFDKFRRDLRTKTNPIEFVSK